MDRFVRWKCCSDILALRPKLFPNAKEITESIGSYYSVLNHIASPLNLKLNDPNTAVVIVGDGVVPRTGAVFAFRSNWSVWSIDPLIRKLDWPIKRLICQKRRIEEEILDLTSFDQVIICLVHSHANLSKTLNNIKGKIRHLSVMECCVIQDLNDTPYLGYTDTSIWSPKNKVKIWLNV